MLNKSRIKDLERANEYFIEDFLKKSIREKLLKDIEVKNLGIWWLKNVFFKEIERVGFNRRLRISAKSIVTLGLIADVDLSKLKQIGEILKRSDQVSEMVDRLILDVIGFSQNYVGDGLTKNFTEEIDEIAFMFSVEIQLAIMLEKFSSDEIKKFLYKLKEILVAQ